MSLGGGVNLTREPRNGRNFEYFGEDPFLAARIAVAYIEGLQAQGVSATIKHFAGNNSEYDRHNINAVIDRTSLVFSRISTPSQKQQRSSIPSTYSAASSS